MSLSCATCDMNTVPLKREMSRQAESEIATPSKCSLGTYGCSLKRTAQQCPIQFLTFLLSIIVICKNVTCLLKILAKLILKLVMVILKAGSLKR